MTLAKATRSQRVGELTLDQFTEMIKNKSFSDEYIANMLSRLVARNIKWKWDNRNKNAVNPYHYLESPISSVLLRTYRPSVFTAVSQKITA